MRKNVNLQTVNEPDKIKRSKKFRAGGDEIEHELLRDLEAACRGLVYISETDAKVEPFVAESPRARSLQAYLNVIGVERNATDIEECDFNKFFDRLTTEKDWYGAREKERASRYSKVRDLLKANLDSLRVIRIGRIQIDIFVAGVTKTGTLAGVKTKSIET